MLQNTPYTGPLATLKMLQNKAFQLRLCMIHRQTTSFVDISTEAGILLSMIHMLRSLRDSTWVTHNNLIHACQPGIPMMRSLRCSTWVTHNHLIYASNTHDTKVYGLNNIVFWLSALNSTCCRIDSSPAKPFKLERPCAIVCCLLLQGRCQWMMLFCRQWLQPDQVQN